MPLTLPTFSDSCAREEFACPHLSFLPSSRFETYRLTFEREGEDTWVRGACVRWNPAPPNNMLGAGAHLLFPRSLISATGKGSDYTGHDVRVLPGSQLRVWGLGGRDPKDTIGVAKRRPYTAAPDAPERRAVGGQGQPEMPTSPDSYNREGLRPPRP